MKAFRKTAMIVFLIVCMAVAAGCSQSQKDPAADPSTVGKTTDVSAGTSTNPSTDSNSGSEVIKEGTIQKDGNVILKELAFVYNGKTIAISDIVDDERLESILGKAAESKSHTYSNDDGLNMDTLIGFTERQYKFQGLGIKSIKAPADENFSIFQIKITDSRYSTIRNIKVGDSVEKLMDAYPEGNMLGNGATGEEDDFQYLPVNYVDGMKFHVKAGKIESILIYKLLD